MAFHPDNCSMLTFTRSYFLPLSNYTLHRQTLERVTSTKYLGAMLKTKLNFTQHIKNIWTKANKTLGFLRQKLKVCSSYNNNNTQELAWKAMVHDLIVEYTMWDQNSDKLVSTLEKGQWSAARFVTKSHWNISSVTEMLIFLEWLTHQWQNCARLVMFHKILNHQWSCAYLERQSQTGCSRNHNQRLQRILPYRLQKVILLPEDCFWASLPPSWWFWGSILHSGAI